MGKEKYGVDAYKKVANMTSDASSKGGDKKTVANTWGLQDLLALAMNQQGTDSRDGSGVQRPMAHQGHGSQQNQPTGHGQAAGGQYTTKPSFGTAEDVSREKKVSETKGAKGFSKIDFSKGSPFASASKTEGTTSGTETSKTDENASLSKDIMRHGLIKVPVAPKTSDGKESMYRRVAKFLILIGTDEAAKVISHLSPEQTERIIPEIASIRGVDPDEAEEILVEFKSLLDNARKQGGVNTAKSILTKAFGDEKATEMINKVLPYPEGEPFDYMQDMDDDRVFQLLKDEPPPVKALILSKIKPATAAGVINMMDDGEKKETIRRLAKLTSISPDIIRRVDEAMHQKVMSMNTTTAHSLDGRGALAEILKRMDPNSEKDILTSLSEQDPDLTQDLRERLFTIDDVVNADDRFIQQQLHAMDEGDIALLIAGKPESFRTKILSNVSKTRAQIILEEEQIRRPMRKRDCNEVTARFFGILRRAWEEGKLIIDGRSDDVYV